MDIINIKQEIEERLKQYEEDNFEEGDIPPWTGYNQQNTSQDNNYTVQEFETYTKIMMELPNRKDSEIDLYVKDENLHIDISEPNENVVHSLDSNHKIENISAEFSQGVLEVDILRDT